LAAGHCAANVLVFLVYVVVAIDVSHRAHDERLREDDAALVVGDLRSNILRVCGKR
jgi:hypothetical protein